MKTIRKGSWFVGFSLLAFAMVCKADSANMIPVVSPTDGSISMEPAPPLVATGGDITLNTVDGVTWRVHTFKAGGVFTVVSGHPGGNIVEALLVGVGDVGEPVTGQPGTNLFLALFSSPGGNGESG